MKRKVQFMMSLILICSVGLSGCGGVKGGAVPDEESADSSQELSMTLPAEPSTLDPSQATDAVSFDVMNNIQEGLFRLNKDNRPEEALVSRMEISPDKKVYTFTLREAKWSDGKPITAQDFEYSWKRTLNPKTASEYSYILYLIKNAEAYNSQKVTADKVGVEALDEKTLKVTLEQPSSYFQGLTAFPVFAPQRKDIVEKYGNQYGTEPDKLVYSGPFTLSGWSHEQQVVLDKNKTYWDRGAVKLEKVTMNIVKDTATGVNLYTSQKTDMTALDSALADAFKKSPEFMPITGAVTQYISFNTKNKFFSNEKIRKAVSYAIDRDSIAKVLKDGSEPAFGFVPPTIIGSGNKAFRKEAVAGHNFNPEEAKQLLEEGMRELGMSEKPKLTLLGYDDYRKQAAVIIQEQLLNTLGLEIQVDPQPMKQKVSREEKGEYEFVYTGWGADYNDPMTFLDTLLSGSSFNTGKWESKEYDALIKKSQTNADFEERTGDLVKAEEIMLDEGAVAPILYGGNIFLIKQYVKDIVFHPVGDLELKWAYLDGKSK